MPNASDFASMDDYASTLFHELTQATGAPHRLDRKFTDKSGKVRNGREDLVAELGASFVCGHLGYSYIDSQSPAYFVFWFLVLLVVCRAFFLVVSFASWVA